jgi:hypothetical protein
MARMTRIFVALAESVSNPCKPSIRGSILSDAAHPRCALCERKIHQKRFGYFHSFGGAG